DHFVVVLPMQGAERPGPYRRKKTLALAIALALAITGCGGKKQAANAPDSNQATNEATNKPPSELDNQALATGAGKATRTIRYWDVEYQSSNAVQHNGEMQGELLGVEGVIYVDGKIAYSFQSKDAAVYFGKNRLNIGGLISVTPAKGIAPVAKTDGGRITWYPELKKFKAGWPDDSELKSTRPNPAPGRLSRTARLWDIEWQSANLFIKQVESPTGDKKTKQFGTMRAAKGVVYKDGQIASTFQTDLAEAFEADDRLKLSGKVVLTSIVIDKKDKSKKTTVLTAKEVTWDPVAQRYIASGAVEVDGPNGYLAPTDKVFATAKLDRIATSEDYFKK
ncbi:MAG TPA: hypothetical protein VK171_02355, partial [Fimbriimonas sp.]|nr:hypothetical protein [Fimbriimonas sp.]